MVSRCSTVGRDSGSLTRYVASLIQHAFHLSVHESRAKRSHGCGDSDNRTGPYFRHGFAETLEDAPRDLLGTLSEELWREMYAGSLG